MKALLDYFLFVLNKIIDILDSLKFGNYSILYYMLGSIIIGFIFKLVKGSVNEFDSSMNFSTGSIIDKSVSKYSKNHDSRKKQIIREDRDKSFRNGFSAGFALCNGNINRFKEYTARECERNRK